MADYIDGFLGAFTFDPPRIWAGGPTSGRHGGVAGFATFHRLSAARRAGLAHAHRGLAGACPSASSTVRSSGSRSATGTGLAALGRRLRRGRTASEQRRRLRADEDFCDAAVRALLRGHVRRARVRRQPRRGRLGLHRLRGRRPAPRATRDAEVSAAVTVDAIIIGSGPGGATAADVLTAAGWSVVIVEKGRNHLLDPDDLTRPAGDYSNDEIKFIVALLPRARPARRAAHLPALGRRGRAHPRRRGELHPDDRRRRRDPRRRQGAPLPGGGLPAASRPTGPRTDADVADWPLDYDELEPYYAEVERAIGVAGREGANPFAGLAVGSLPDAAGGADVRRHAVVGRRREGRATTPTRRPTAANSVPYDGRPACNNCGFCAFFGCPIHAKGDPVALLTRAMATGRAELHGRDLRQPRSSPRAGGPPGSSSSGPTASTHTMDAEHRRRGRRRDRDAAAPAAVGPGAPGPRPVPDGPLPDHRGRPLPGPAPAPAQGPGRDPRARRRHGAGRRLAAGGGRGRAALVPRRPGRAQRGRPARSWRPRHSPWGTAPRPAMRESNLRERMWAFIMQGEDLPYADQHGRPRARPSATPAASRWPGSPTSPGHHELAASKHHGQILQAVLEEMGAEWVIAHLLAGRLVPRRRAPTPIPESRHVMGTVRMGDDPRHLGGRPLGPGARARQRRGGRLLGLRHLEPATGPTLTLAALAARAAAPPGSGRRRRLRLRVHVGSQDPSAHAAGEQHGAGDRPAAVGHRGHLGQPAARPHHLALAALARAAARTPRG